MMRLENYDFPAYELLMRPDVVDIMKEDKEQFTRKAHYLLERHPTIVGIIDNSKSLSEELATLDYPGINILYGHPHNADSPATHQLQHRHEIESLLGKGILE
jgi:hypothetical protein